MYIQLSTKHILDANNIIGVFDIENTTTAKSTRGFLYGFEKDRVITVGKKIPQTFILYRDKEEFTIYMIDKSVREIRRELKNIENVENLKKGDGKH